VEENAPDGYDLPHTVTSDLIVIDENNAGTTALTQQAYEFSNPRHEGRIIIKKYHSTTDGTLTATRLPGASFLIYEDTDKSGTFDVAQDQEVDNCTTSDLQTPDPDTYGMCMIDDLNTSTRSGGTNSYFVVETDAPQGYILPQQAVSHLITLTGDADDASATYEYVLGNIPETSTVEVKKIDATTGEALAGARFGLVSVDGSGSPSGPVIKECTTSGGDVASPEFGTCSLDVTDYGDYRWQELSAPQGYMIPSDPYSDVLRISEGGSISAAISMANQQKLTELTIKKLGADSTTALAGATFALYRRADATHQPGDQHAPEDVKIEECESNTEGICTVTGLNFGSYFWEEIVAPDGYALPKDRTTALISIDAHNAGTQLPVVTFSDPISPSSITVRKFVRTPAGYADMTKPLGGASFALYLDSNNNELYDVDSDKEINQCQTDLFSGECSFEALSPASYFVVERQAPAGYDLPEQNISHVIVLEDLGYDADNNPKATDYEYIVGNNPKPSSLTVRKSDDSTGDDLYGAVFALYKDASDTGVYNPETVDHVASCVTTKAESGTCTVSGLSIGVYFWKEITAPVGYQLPSEQVSTAIEIKIPDSHNAERPTVFTDTAKLTTLRLLKHDLSRNPLAGASFDVYRSADPSQQPGDTHASSDHKVGSCTTNVQGICEVTGLGFASYFWEETQSPAGYELPVDRTSALVTVGAENAGTSVPPVIVTNPRSPGSISVSKRDIDDTAQKLAGATFALYDDADTSGSLTPEDHMIGECTTSGPDGVCHFEDLAVSTAGELYFVTEVSAPLGYQLSTTVYPITLTDEAPLETLEVENSPQHSVVSILKKDADHYVPLSGATFTLFLDKNADNVVDEDDIKIDSCTTQISDVAPDGRCSVVVQGFGDFLWIETAAPPGYVLRRGVVGSVHVEPSNAGADLNAVHPTVVINNNMPTLLHVQKTDAETGQRLAGAVFDLSQDINANGKLDDTDAFINSCTTSSNGLCSIYVDGSGPYLFTERRAPIGYQRDAHWVGLVTVNSSNAGDTVSPLILANRQIPSALVVHKADIDNPERTLAGATFVLFRYQGNASPLPSGAILEAASQRIGLCTSNDEGLCSIGNLVFGTYFWKESKAPQGYLLPTNPYSETIAITHINAGSEHLAQTLFLDTALSEPPTPTPTPDKPTPTSPPTTPTPEIPPSNPQTPNMPSPSSPSNQSAASNADSASQPAIASTGTSVLGVIWAALGLMFLAVMGIYLSRHHRLR
jgi:uncharacterized surface anchored protein